MSEPRRLHPITALLHALKSLKELIIPFLAFIVFGSKGIITSFMISIGSFVILALILFTGVVSWLRYTYRLEDDELRIEYGVFVRKKRYIPFERIQSLDFSEGILHRLFGLVKVKVETAGGGTQADAVLTAITKGEAQKIESILQEARNKGLSKEESEMLTESITPKETVLYRITMKELILMASTSGGVGVVISAVVAFLSQFEEMIPYERLFAGLEDFIANGVIFITFVVLIGFIIAWLIAIVGMMLKYADFTLKKVGNDLVISRGLLEKKQVTIPLKRIQGVRISENLIRQPLGYATVIIESAGGSVQESDSSRVIILPIIKKEKIKDIIEQNLEGYRLEHVINPVPKRALRRYHFRALFWVIPICVLFIALFKIWGLLSLLLIPVALYWSYLKFKDAGWYLEVNQLTLSYRSFVKHTVFLQKNKIQSLKRKDSYFQTRKDLASVQALIKSGIGASGGTVVDLDKNDVAVIYEWFSRSGSTKSENII